METDMLDANLKGQRKAYMANITQPIELVASLDDGAKSRELKTLLEEIAELSDKVSIAAGSDRRVPSFMIRRAGTDIVVTFAGLPMGHEFTSLVLALLQVGGHPSKRSEERRVGKECVRRVDLGGRRIIKKTKTRQKSIIERKQL